MTRKYSKQKETDICGKSLEDRQAMYGLWGDDVRRLSWPKVLREMQKGSVPEKDEPKPKKLTLQDIMREADKEGLQYASYCKKHGLY